MLGTGIRVTHAVRDGVSRAAWRRTAYLSSWDKYAGSAQSAVANPVFLRCESPVRTKPWPSRRSVKDVRRQGHLPPGRTTKKPLRSRRDPVRRRTGIKLATSNLAASQNRSPVLSNFFLRPGSPYADARTFCLFRNSFVYDASRCALIARGQGREKRRSQNDER